MDKQKAMERLDAIEEEAKKLRAIIKAPEKPEPRWKSHPEELVGKLCRFADKIDQLDTGRIGICTLTEDAIFPYRSRDWSATWKLAKPLTPAEIAAMTYRESRYDWSKAPKDAKIAVTNDNGDMYWGSYISAEPNSYGGWGGYSNGSWIEIGNIGACPDWRDSLEHRPE